MPETDFLRATRTAYDTMASEYAARFADELGGQPLDRAMLAGFAELVREAGVGPVADVGCGHGHVTARLHALGVPAFGIDLSPGMLAEARRRYPGLRFDEGSMTALDLPDGSLGGVVSMYAVIHVPDDHLPGVLAEFHRVLAPGGHLLLVFQVGDDDRVRRTEAFGHDIALDYHRRQPDRVTGLLRGAGLVPAAQLLREPDGEERAPRAFLLARKPPAAATGD